MVTGVGVAVEKVSVPLKRRSVSLIAPVAPLMFRAVKAMAELPAPKLAPVSSKKIELIPSVSLRAVPAATVGVAKTK